MDGSFDLFPLFEKFGAFLQSAEFREIGIFTIGYLAALWLAIIIWVTRDAMERSSSLLFQVGAVLLNIFLPVLGLILYLILRPGQTLIGKYHEDLIAAAAHFCPSCQLASGHDLDFCPHCGEKLSRHCRFCQKLFFRSWEFCPHCGRDQEEGSEFAGKKGHAKPSGKKSGGEKSD